MIVLAYPTKVINPELSIVKPTSSFKQKFLASKLSVIGAIWIAIWVFIAVSGPLLRPDPTPYANDQFLEFSLIGPGSEVIKPNGEEFTYWLGSDRYGRDFLSRLMAGSAISLSVAGVAVLISLVIGLLQELLLDIEVEELML